MSSAESHIDEVKALVSNRVLLDAHAPKHRLGCGHTYRLSWLSMGNWLVGVGGAHQCPKLQELVIWTREEHR